MKLKFYLVILIFSINLISCQSLIKSNMETSSELIFSNKLDENLTVECFFSNDELNYKWEFLLKDKQRNLKIDRLKISKQELSGYNPLANRPQFYRQFKILTAFKNLDDIVFVIDKFGQIDINIYSISNKTKKEVIVVKKTDLSPMDTEILGENFQDIKVDNGIVYFLSKHLRRSNSMYYISRVNLQNKKSEEGSIDVSKRDLNKDTEQLEKSSIYLEDRSYKLNKFGYKFYLYDNNIVYVQKDNLKPFEAKLEYHTSNIENSQDINSILKSY